MKHPNSNQHSSLTMHLFQSLKLSLLLIGGSVLLSGPAAIDQSQPHDNNAEILSAVSMGLTRSAGSRTQAVSPAEQSQSAVKPLNLKQQGEAESSVSINLCVSLPDWQRPSEQTQRKRLAEMGRYDGFLQDETLVSLAKDWWTHEVFSFTTYGLSARTDPHYLSGIWTALDEIWDCYGGEQPQQINSGELAELWLIHHRLVDITWQDNQYVVTVEPDGHGLQLVQFSRSEDYDALPVVVITPAGEEIAVMSGDW